MKQHLLLALALLSLPQLAKANIIRDNFESNAFGWTECAVESNSGTSVIDKGKLTVKSKGENKAAGIALTLLSGVPTKVGQNTFFETHCYSPIDVTKDFKITADVLIEKLADDKMCGLVFNYRDAGNFYVFAFNDKMVSFRRFKDGEVVGHINQGMKWQKKTKSQQLWKLSNEADELVFSIDDMEVMRVKYMPLEYSGIGFYTYGKQKLEVNEMTYEQ